MNRIPHVLILGSGIAGLSSALKFADSGTRVTLLAKVDAAEGSTRYAQGGIASVWSKEDSFDEHKQDTLIAGADLCHEDVVDLTVREGPDRVRELIALGVNFTRVANGSGDPTEEFSLHREGGHGQRRILHAADLTGWEIEKALLAQASLHPQISILEDHCAIDLITEGKVFKAFRAPGRCLGAYALNTKSGHVETIAADSVILATGGAGKVYLYTSNPDTTTGDGIAMAFRAGAKVANLEFIQFHPTCLYHPTARTFLITEALRGEGAILRNLDGESFMDKIHPLGSLAPRDIVARGIDMEMKRTGHTHVFLDPSALPAEELRAKFPNIDETLLKLGIDFTRQSIPVVPAAHYTCGGVQVDTHGRTNVEGLYAIGEVSCTGLHGANRLASNSLLEAVVYAHRVFEDVRGKLADTVARPRANLPPALPVWETGQAVELEEQIDITATWYEIRSLMWNYVGIVRSNRRLDRAQRRIELLKNEINTYYWNYLLTKDLIELRNLVQVAELIVTCAQLRRESRGLHYTIDYPEKRPEFHRDTVVG